ncbi:MAG TPA: flagellin [Edaphobacter sp.]|nr:flagellin [Edaphobacter sp.]
MLSNIDPSGQQFLNSLNRLQARLDTAQRQLASGNRLNVPSDAPDQISPVLQLHADIRMNQAIASNLKQVKTDVDTAEQTISSSVDLLQQASVLATQATGPLQTAATRATLAANVEGLLEQMISNSNTTVGGRYIFSGDSDQSQAYQLDLTSVTGAAALQNPPAAATRKVAGPGGSSFLIGRTAGDIFDVRDPVTGAPASGNVFAALNGLRVALAANDDAGIRTSITDLASASKYLNDQLAFYGQTQDRIASALNATNNTDVQLQAELSGRQEADMASVITDLQQAETQMQAALQVRAQIPRSSLFDVLSK